MESSFWIAVRPRYGYLWHSFSTFVFLFTHSFFDHLLMHFQLNSFSFFFFVFSHSFFDLLLIHFSTKFIFQGTGTFDTDACIAPPPVRECSPMDEDQPMPFTDVEGESINGYVAFGRCSRTMMVIKTADTKECTSCGRAVTVASLEWSWLSHKGCGVCGTSVRWTCLLKSTCRCKTQKKD